MTDQNNTGNGGLYFVVGALVVAVAIMGYFFVASDNTNVSNMEPAAGIERTVEETSSSFEVEMDEDGISGTTTQTNEN